MSGLTANPQRSYPQHALVDDASADVLDDAVFALVAVRSPMLIDDVGAELHALASLAAEIAKRLPEVVWEARTKGLAWSTIGCQLGLSTAAARRRYSDDEEVAARR